MKKKILVGLAMGFFMFGIVGMANASLITNGDFESGDTGFFTDYSDVGIVTESAYSITTNPSLNHADATSYGDHTTGNGYMMAVNGATIQDKVVWGQNVELQSNTNYTFSIFISSWHIDNFADLTFSLNNGQITLGTVTVPINTGIWEEYQVSFNSGSLAGLTSISFVDENLNYYGNDFAIDDISINPVPVPATILLFGTGLAGLAGLAGSRIRRKKKA